MTALFKISFLVPSWSLLLVVLLSGSVSAYDAWRRMEVIIGGFRSFKSQSKGNQEYVIVNINGINVTHRKLEEPAAGLDEDDFFLFADIFNDYPYLEEQYLYFKTDPTFGVSVFENPLLVTLYYFYELYGVNVSAVELKIDKDLRGAPDSDWKYLHTFGSEYKVKVFVSTWCEGFTGQGCQFECFEDSNTAYTCDYSTGIRICKDPSKRNPPKCDSPFRECSPEEKKRCKHNSTCKSFHEQNYMCVCPKGRRGKHCENFYCDPPCHPEFGKCVGPNKCECVEGRMGPTCESPDCNGTISGCKNNGTCIRVGNGTICQCDSSNFGGEKCEARCFPACMVGFCTSVKGRGVCQCYPGFVGFACDKFVPPREPIVEPLYVSKQMQKISYVVATVLMAFLAIGLISIGMYRRSHSKRMLKVIKGTEVAVKTLQAERAQNREAGIIN